MTLTPYQHQSILELVVKAGQEALWMRAHGMLNPRWKDDREWSVVTDADIVVHDILVQGLAAFDPEVPVVSEEDVKHSRAGRYLTRWVVDPIDGSKSFNDGGPDFGVLAALVVRGKPVHGFAYYPDPRYGRIYFTDAEGKKAYRQNVTFAFGDQARLSDTQQLRLQTTDRTLRVVQDYTNVKDYFRHHFIVPQHKSPSGLIALLEGQTDLTAGPTTMADWDLAAADALLRCAGGMIVGVARRRPLKYGEKRPEARAYLQPRYIAGSEEILRRTGLLKPYPCR